MNILTIETVLKSDGVSPDVETLGHHIDAMHDFLTADETVLSADIVTVGGSEVHVLIRITNADGESNDETEARVEPLLEAAYAAAGMKISSAVEHEGAANETVVKEFALV